MLQVIHKYQQDCANEFSDWQYFFFFFWIHWILNIENIGIVMKQNPKQLASGKD